MPLRLEHVYMAKSAPMSNRPRLRRAMLAAALEFVPPRIRNSILADEALRDTFGVTLDAVISFGEEKVAFQRSTLYAAVRAAAASARKSHKLRDQAGTEWVMVVRKVGDAPNIVLSAGTRTLHAPQFVLLTQMKRARNAFFGAESTRLNLPASSVSRWREILRKRPLADNELDQLLLELLRTPVARATLIRQQLAQQDISLDILVPKSLDYYEELIGRHSGEATIREYAEAVLAPHIRSLVAWNRIEGFKLALLLDSHPCVTDILARERLSPAEMNLIVGLSRDADAIARSSVLALAIRRPGGNRTLKENVRHLAERVAIQGEGGADEFALLFAAFVMVDGELAKSRLMAAKPPYWRRLAGLAQAALISRCIFSLSGDFTKMISWMRSVRLSEHFMQSFADLRTEPRWIAEFGVPRQLRHETAGRALIAALKHPEAVDRLGLHDLLLGDKPSSLKSQLNMTLVGLPGPLEGNSQPDAELGAKILRKIKKDLSAPSPGLTAFARLANMAFFCKLPVELLRLAAEAIRRVKYHLEFDGKREAFQSALAGLAIAAAICRSHELADELFVMIRNYRLFFRAELDIDAAFRVGMIACASRAELADWCKSVGTLITELGFGEIERAEALALSRLATELCNLVPELWATCGQGISALEAVATS